MYLSLPLPSTTMRIMTLTVLSTDGTALPTPFTITVPKSGRLVDLTDALSIACSLRDDETLMVAEVYAGSMFSGNTLLHVVGGWWERYNVCPYGWMACMHDRFICHTAVMMLSAVWFSSTNCWYFENYVASLRFQLLAFYHAFIIDRLVIRQSWCCPNFGFLALIVCLLKIVWLFVLSPPTFCQN